MSGRVLFIVLTAVLLLGAATIYLHDQLQAAPEQKLTWFQLGANESNDAYQVEAVHTPDGVTAFRVRLKRQGEETRSDVFQIQHCLPSEEKIDRNPRSRSARLRVAVRNEESVS